MVEGEARGRVMSGGEQYRTSSNCIFNLLLWFSDSSLSKESCSFTFTSDVFCWRQGGGGTVNESMDRGEREGREGLGLGARTRDTHVQPYLVLQAELPLTNLHFCVKDDLQLEGVERLNTGWVSLERTRTRRGGRETLNERLQPTQQTGPCSAGCYPTTAHLHLLARLLLQLGQLLSLLQYLPIFLHQLHAPLVCRRPCEKRGN